LGSLHGFFQRGRFDVTSLVHPGAGNCLAVLAYVPALTQGEKENTASPTFICSRGWDWMPKVPGLNMGIYKDVFLSNTGRVSIIDPWIRSDLPTLNQANLSIQTDLANNSAAAVSGVLTGEINPGHIAFSHRVSLNADATTTVRLTSAEIAALHIVHPRLWWPNGYGDPNLYTCRLAFKQGASVSDTKTVSFGIRKYTYDTNNDTLHFHINGVRVFPKGGSWGMAEYLLRCSAKDYDTKLRFHREMHFNMIRNWMGMTADAAFYDACDKYGIMVWDEFWLNSRGQVPSDIPLYNANVIEKIKQVRNHPCVAFWCADNEGTPEPEINDGLIADVHTYDGDDRRYQPNSHANSLSGSGPWHDLPLKQYFVGSHGGGGTNSGYGMRSELGIATFPNFDSVKKFLPKSDWWPKNSVWDQHFWGYAANAWPEAYFTHISNQYGASQGIEEFCNKAQLLNYEAMKALYEGFDDHSDSTASGVLIWMSQSAYPSFVWQTYDYYYDTTGSYWGAKSACEPIHIYWNCNDDRIRVSNTSRMPAYNLTANAWIYNLNGKQKYHQTAKVTSLPYNVATCFTLAYPAGLSDTHFIRLRLTNAAGKTVSDNFYWRAVKGMRFTALNTMPKVNLIAVTHVSTAGGTDTMTAAITNPAASKSVAFAIRPKLVNPATGNEILPVYMTDGYFSLLPGETKTISIQFDHALASAKAPKLVIECYNNDYKSPEVTPGEDIAYKKPVTASSSAPEAPDPNAVVDGDSTTRWSSAYSDPQWICIDLGSTKQIASVMLSWEDSYAKAYQIQVSDDQTNWTTIYQTSDGKGGDVELTGLKGNGRYVRMYGTQRALKYGYSLYEFAVYGPPSAK
jgi:hypothetical protein